MKLFVLLILIASALQGQALEESPFENFIVAVWPEYDHPGILVIYMGSIKDDYLPLDLKARVPDETGIVMAMGQSDTTSNLQPLELTEREDSKWVDVTLVRRDFQMEYYFNPFGVSEERNGSITIQFNHPLENYHIAMQRPLGAEQFSFSEKDVESFRDDHGMNFLRTHVLRLEKNAKKTISFSYRNPSGNLSIVLLQEMLGTDSTLPPSKGVSEEKVSRYRLPTYEPMAILGIVALAIGYLFWRSNNKVPQVAKKNFCPKCGTRMDKGDRYCTNCGNKLV